MVYTEEGGYLGKVCFEVEHHQQPYEMTIQRKKEKDWGYALFFWQASGPEEEIEAVDAYLEDNDEAFERLVKAAMDTYVHR